MKLVYQTFDDSKANEIKGLLERNGIPATLANESTHGIRKYIGGALGVWVYINEQEDEALKLIDNPSYIVSNRVSVSEFYSKAKNGVQKEAANTLILKTSVLALVVLLSFILLIYVIQKIQT